MNAVRIVLIVLTLMLRAPVKTRRLQCRFHKIMYGQIGHGLQIVVRTHGGSNVPLISTATSEILVELVQKFTVILLGG